MIITKSLQEVMIDQLRDPEFAAEYLKHCLEEFDQDGDLEIVFSALKDVAKAQGSLDKFFKKKNINIELEFTAFDRTHKIDFLSCLKNNCFQFS